MTIYELVLNIGAHLQENTLYTDKVQAVKDSEELRKESQGGTECWLFVWSESDRPGKFEIEDSTLLWMK